MAQAVLAANPEAVSDYEAGQQGAVNFLVGRVLARTKGRADPKQARGLLEDLLGED